MPDLFPGLCGDCAHARLIDSGRSTFYLCQLAQTDPRFYRYPVLPVMMCPGYQPSPPGPDDKLTG